MSKKTYAVAGATGHIGSVLAEKLLERGHEVRALGRDEKKLAVLTAKGAQAFSPAIDDPGALASVFRGADAVFLLIPPNYGEADFSAYQVRVGEALVRAVSQSGVKHAVDLSSIGADKPAGNGPIANLYKLERGLEKLSGLNVLHLRPGYFMENLFWAIPILKGMGVYGTPLRADLAMAMVATRDIGVKAAGILDSLAFTGASALEFAGPRDYTMAEVAALLGQAIGKPGLPYVQFPYEEAKKGMMQGGLNEKMAGMMVEMNKAFNDGLVGPTQKLEGGHRGTTTLEEFLGGFAAAYKNS